MVTCRCGKVQCLECELECSRCHDKIENYPGVAPRCVRRVGGDDVEDVAFSKQCPGCGMVLADMSGMDREAFFASGRCRACGGKRE